MIKHIKPSKAKAKKEAKSSRAKPKKRTSQMTLPPSSRSKEDILFDKVCMFMAQTLTNKAKELPF